MALGGCVRWPRTLTKRVRNGSECHKEVTGVHKPVGPASTHPRLGWHPPTPGIDMLELTRACGPSLCVLATPMASDYCLPLSLPSSPSSLDHHVMPHAVHPPRTHTHTKSINECSQWSAIVSVHTTKCLTPFIKCTASLAIKGQQRV